MSGEHDEADDAVEIASFAKNKRELLKVHVATYRGHRLASVRVWAPGAGDGDMVPTKKGVTFNVALLPDLIEALTRARAAVATGGTPGRTT